MSRTRRFLSGVGLGLLMQAIVTGAGLWLTPFLIHKLGDHDYGLWLVATQLLSYLMLADLGVVALLPRETAYVTGRVGSGPLVPELRELVGRTLRLILWQTALVAPAAVAMWMLLPQQWIELRWPLAAVFAAFVLTFPLRAFPAVLNGLQDFTWLTITGLAAWALGMLVSIVLVLAGAGLYSVALGWIVTQAVTNGVAFFRLVGLHRGVVPRRLPKLPWSEARSSLTKGTWISVSQISTALQVGSDLLILGRLLGPAAVVPYSVTGKLITVLAQQPSIFLHSALPALAEMRAARDHESLRRVLGVLTHGMLLLSGLVTCIVLAVNQGFVSWWIDESRFGGLLLTTLLLVSMLLRHWNLTLSAAMLSFGLEKRGSITGLIDGASTVVAMVVLVHLGLGALAAPIAFIATALLVSIPANLLAVSRELELTVLTVIGAAAAPFARIAVVGTAAVLLARHWVPRTFWELAATTVAVTLLYGLVMLPLLFRHPMSAYVVPRLPRAPLMWRALRWAGLTS